MPREHKYRGKRVDNGEWTDGGCVEIDGRLFIVPSNAKIVDCHNSTAIFSTKKYISGFIVVRPETVGQWTGREAQQNKKIYVDDVIKFCLSESPHFMQHTGIVYWCEKELAYMVKREEATDKRLSDIMRDYSVVKVIGTVHDEMEGK